MPFATRLEAVDAQHRDVMALVTGPLVLMALRSGGAGGGFDAAQQHVAQGMLLAAKQSADRGMNGRQALARRHCG